MLADETAGFGRFRSFFFPIHVHELKKLLPMLGMFFLISFNYNALRAYKDSMVVTAPQSGAEVIPFIKVWAIMPFAILLTLLFTRLLNRFNREKVFYIMMSIFLVFFAVFTFVLLPLQDYLHPNETADLFQSLLPEGLKGLIAIFRNWTFTLFYVMSDLWSSAIMAVLFWGFANEVTSVDEAKRFYGPLMIGANLGGMLAGQASVTFLTLNYIPWIPYGQSPWEQSILFLTIALLVSGLLTMGIFRWVNKKVIGPMDAERPVPEKVKMSIRKSFSYLMRSKYLICIAVLVLAYNLTMNLVEIVWKDQIKQVYPNSSEYGAYMGGVMIWMELLAIITSLFVTGNLIRRFSWTFSAFLPVIVMALFGAAFFLSGTYTSYISATWGVAPMMVVMTVGTLHNCITRASKYTFFDTTKEIAFIPLNSESKIKGKAAIDGVGSRLGKSASSFIHQGLLLFCTTISAAVPYVATVFMVVLCVWGVAVVMLGRQFDALTGRRPAQADRKPVLVKDLA